MEHLMVKKPQNVMSLLPALTAPLLILVMSPNVDVKYESKVITEMLHRI
jgi:hypothetical protein